MKEASWIIDQLILQGITKFCIAPGSRSAPLAIAAASHPKADVTIHFDERGLGFFALGYGKGAKKPAAVIVTSGTAVANLLPSVMEAFCSATPLILLTADRPHELRACGANQTADQTKIFSNLTRWQMDLTSSLDEKTLRSIAAQAVAYSLNNPPGPIHLNCPFKEPLYTPSSPDLPRQKISFLQPKLMNDPVHLEARRGIILLGPLPTNPTPVLDLAKRLKWPIFADILSNARCTPSEEQIRYFDFLIRAKDTPTPDLILHFGERMISKHILNWAENSPLIHVSPYPFLQDPTRRVKLRIQSDIKSFCSSFQAFSDPKHLLEWQTLDHAMEHQINAHFANSPFTEAHAIRALPSNTPIYFGNSMPIRLADRFFFPNSCLPFFANRGVSGIDGNIATAAGIADALKTPVLAFLGDQTTLHDLNSFALLKKYPVQLIISNNFGGAIFDYLPSFNSPHLETLFAASHTWSFEHAAKMFDIPYLQTKESFPSFPFSGIIELITDRKTNRNFQIPCSLKHA